MAQTIFHSVLYYVAWFACIELATKNHGYYAAGIVFLIALGQIVWQIGVAKRTRGLWLMILLFTLFGVAVDTTFVNTGVIVFAGNSFRNHSSPIWMASLWVCFSIVFYSLLQNFFQRYLLLAFLSLVFFPLSYFLGVQMGAAQVLDGEYSFLMVGLVWMILFPLTLKIYNCYYGRSASVS